MFCHWISRIPWTPSNVLYTGQAAIFYRLPEDATSFFKINFDPNVPKYQKYVNPKILRHMASYLHFNKRNYGLQTEEICTDDVGRTWTKAIKTECRQIYTKQLKEQQRFQRVFGRKKILALFKFVLFFFLNSTQIIRVLTNTFNIFTCIFGKLI